jgi:hypothetical protein
LLPVRGLCWTADDPCAGVFCVYYTTDPNSV